MTGMLGLGTKLFCEYYVPVLTSMLFVASVCLCGMVHATALRAALRASFCDVAKGVNGDAPDRLVSAVLILLIAAMMMSANNIVGICTHFGNHATVLHVFSLLISHIQIQ